MKRGAFIEKVVESHPDTGGRTIASEASRLHAVVQAAVRAAYPGEQQGKNFEALMLLARPAALRAFRKHK